MWDLLLLGCAATAVVAGCLVPNRLLPPLPNDKFLHFAAFALLSGLALRMAHDLREAVAWLLSLLVLGWLIECLQILVPDRHFCWRDIGANASGILFSALIAALYPVFA